MPDLSIKNFAIGSLLAAATGLGLIFLSTFLGKINLFLFLNGDLGVIADWIFEYATYLGDGAIWVPVALLCIIYRRKYLILLFGSIIYSTLIAQLTKNFIFPAAPRPTKLIHDIRLIHTVPGVELHTIYSFPSGHTTTASSIFLLGCLLIPKKWIIPAGFAYTLLVGYSRIYLAQHFPLDVGAGMVGGIISVYFSLRLQTWRDNASKLA